MKHNSCLKRLWSLWFVLIFLFVLPFTLFSVTLICGSFTTQWISKNKLTSNILDKISTDVLSGINLQIGNVINYQESFNNMLSGNEYNIYNDSSILLAGNFIEFGQSFMKSQDILLLVRYCETNHKCITITRDSGEMSYTFFPVDGRVVSCSLDYESCKELRPIGTYKILTKDYYFNPISTNISSWDVYWSKADGGSRAISFSKPYHFIDGNIKSIINICFSTSKTDKLLVDIKSKNENFIKGIILFDFNGVIISNSYNHTLNKKNEIVTVFDENNNDTYSKSIFQNTRFGEFVTYERSYIKYSKIQDDQGFDKFILAVIMDKNEIDKPSIINLLSSIGFFVVVITVCLIFIVIVSIYVHKCSNSLLHLIRYAKNFNFEIGQVRREESCLNSCFIYEFKQLLFEFIKLEDKLKEATAFVPKDFKEGVVVDKDESPDSSNSSSSIFSIDSSESTKRFKKYDIGTKVEFSSIVCILFGDYLSETYKICCEVLKNILYNKGRIIPSGSDNAIYIKFDIERKETLRKRSIMFALEILKRNKYLKIAIEFSDFEVVVCGTKFEKYVIVEKANLLKTICEIGDYGKIYTIFENFIGYDKDYYFNPIEFLIYKKNVRAIAEISLIESKWENKEWLYEYCNDQIKKEKSIEKDVLLSFYDNNTTKIKEYKGENKVLLRIKKNIDQWKPGEHFYDFVKKIFEI